MIRIFSVCVILLFTASLASAQAVNPARSYEQQRNSQPPADGVWHVYDKNGNLQKEEHYKTYRLDGEVKTFSPGGGLKAVTPYVDGSRHGLEKTYYPSGSLQGENLYVNNDLKGQSKEYFETGELKRTATYKSGQLDGITKIYYENGALRQQWDYKQGVIHGTALTYAQDGQIKSEDNYQNGVLVAHKDYGADVAAMRSGATTRPPAAGTANPTLRSGKEGPPPVGKDIPSSGPAGSTPTGGK